MGKKRVQNVSTEVRCVTVKRPWSFLLRLLFQDRVYVRTLLQETEVGQNGSIYQYGIRVLGMANLPDPYIPPAQAIGAVRQPTDR